jgi:hypothetical protein
MMIGFTNAYSTIRTNHPCLRTMTRSWVSLNVWGKSGSKALSATDGLLLTQYIVVGRLLEEQAHAEE